MMNRGIVKRTPGMSRSTSTVTVPEWGVGNSLTSPALPHLPPQNISDVMKKAEWSKLTDLSKVSRHEKCLDSLTLKF